ncbi:similar to Saccharomyces cerevisiae YCR081W SRB8 Subunit of the RNA polymerase II mediator complex [Maudiozyma barnettii]|uniref:Mediator of RNA polymerase II transcription subunit 12 n=1 Tax=Maudiozyma barnettii TaxID=61262 RepID=A0A8H2ZIB4_9SACH|nr:Srb8p [Kazachstania barnettii]CAB4254778.1 similar to Saccharomyces cerevisiae YCR081W SRB8 Subunit of the RNA polymerase II mediator complex [Kazachstania barnettii]CAD1782919.1 similar to Saccharomyces cerevisiae YCR081W SRB8 Subunit of the RNA polymerase II mediator complex [Kazachstania barnettii]
MSPSKYILTPPEDLHPYIARDSDTNEDEIDYGMERRHFVPETNESEQFDPVYPDFDRWKHRAEEDQIFMNFVSKGYYTTSKVNFESISARSSLHESLPKISDQLGVQFSKILQIREGEINRIPATVPTPNDSSNEQTFTTNKIYDLAGPGFALPTRVTLTDNRKESWLYDLSKPYVSLHNVSKYIPHGLKRKRVIEQCYKKQIPLKRAMWLIKCCFLIEIQQSKSKHSSGAMRSHTPPAIRSPSNININIETPMTHILKEWTESFINLLEKLIFEMSQYYNDADKLKMWKVEISYFLKLLGNCYSVILLDRNIFHRWLIEFVSKVENFEFLPITLHILMTFWDNITKTNEHPNQLKCSNSSNFLLSKITDLLLHKYYVVSNAKSMINDERYIINDIKKNNKLKDSILVILTTMIIKLFKEQSLEVFLFPPSSWELYKPCLYEIINKTQLIENADEIRKILELISYRNETLKNTTLITEEKINSNDENASDHKEYYFKCSQVQPDIKVIKISHIDTKFTTLLDDNSTEFDWTQYIEHDPLNKSQIIQLLLWSIHPSRLSHYESNQLVAKLLLLQINSFEGFPEYEIEDTLWSLIFQIAKLDSQNLGNMIHLESLYLLLNILITYGIIKVSTYVRKLISSGIMYLQDSNDKFFHVVLLINLKISPLMKTQYNMVLRNVMEFDPYYFENYSFDKLAIKIDDIKEKILGTSFDDGQAINMINFDEINLPLGGKIMLAEWYLNHICSSVALRPINRETLFNNFKFFCLNLKVSHHFYKWCEFIVYHQLLNDIETMALLIDILVSFQKLFSQYINDHALFMKTFLFIYTKILRETDSVNFQIVSFMPFWKFFMKTFPMALTIDTDLRNDLSAMYEEDKTKRLALEQSKELVQQLFDVLSQNKSSMKNLNFAELFQSNIKCLLSYKVQRSLEDFKRAKSVLTLLKSSSLHDYNKFMSIFLKRKNYGDTDLICLISNKLLSLEQIKTTLGGAWIMKFLVYLEEKAGELFSEEHTHFINTIYYEHYMIEYVRTNFKTVLTLCDLKDDSQYKLFTRMLTKYGPSSKFAEVSAEVIIHLLNDHPEDGHRILGDLLQYKGTIKESSPVNDSNELNITESEDDISMTSETDYEVFGLLDFTNLWIFQAYTLHNIDQIKMQDNHSDVLGKFIFDIIELTQYDALCSRIFDRVSDIKITADIIQIFEKSLFDHILANVEISRNYLVIVIESIIALSKKITEVTSTTLTMSDGSIQLLLSIISFFNNLDNVALREKESVMDVVMKIFTIHQAYILKYIVERLKGKLTANGMKTLINDMLCLFQKLSFSLRLKLILYEILSSLKSYSIYMATSDGEQDSAENFDVSTPLASRNSSTNLYFSCKSQTFDIPKELLKLPPLQVSSFTSMPTESKTNVTTSLGVTPMNKERESSKGEVYNEEEKERWFIYDKKTRAYITKLKTQAYYNINSYQTDQDPIKSINNACYNLSLFDASFENKNPA